MLAVAIGAKDALHAAFPRIHVDAKVSRQPGSIFDNIRARKQAGRLGAVVVIGAGTNGTIVASDLYSLLKQLKDRTLVILVTCRADRSWIAKNNRIIWAANAMFGPGKGNVRVADWVSFSAGHRAWLYADGIHPRPGPGATAYVTMLRQVMRV